MSEDLLKRIEINPRITQGKAVIPGTRITVELILRKMAEGADEGAILSAYPHLAREDIQAALTYAADVIAHEQLLPTPQLPRVRVGPGRFQP